jgi:DNA-binding NarL/FixJ family response regulator
VFVKILIVDDSDIMRERLIAMISEIEGVKVIGQAQNADEAMELVEKLEPDVVILDIRMTGESGISVLQKIKTKKPAPIVIVFTNYPYPQYRQICLKLGADYFFDKSTEFNRIPETFKELVHRSDIAGKKEKLNNEKEN